ncbi:MAG: porin [Thiolinea sp.]
MKMRFLLSVAVAIGCIGQAVAADEQAAPTVFGTVRVQQEMLNNGKDDGFRVGQASVGVKGALSFDEFKAIYETEVEFADLANPDNASDSNEARVRTARVIVPTKNAGTFVLGRTASGVWADSYGHLDLFENTENYNPASGSYTFSSGLMGQALRAPGVAAWKSPTFGGVYIVPAVLSVNDSNGQSDDVLSVRAVYAKDGIKVSASYVGVDPSAAAGKDYERTAIGASYKADKWQIGATHENNSDHPSGDFTVNAIAGRVQVAPRTNINLGYFDKDHDNNALDNSAIIGNVTYDLGGNAVKGARLFLEHEEHDIDANDKTTAGITVKF